MNKNHTYEVCVIGGGLAGVCAAIASARTGVNTLLIHDRPVLGGNASSEIRMWICGAEGKNLKETGILEEIQLENAYRNPTLNYHIWDSILYEKVMFQPNLTLLLNTSCTDCLAVGPSDARTIQSITCWQLTTQTWHHIQANIFIDCSGDSILALGSGAEFRMGREARAEFDEPIAPVSPDNKTMGNSLLIQVRRTETPRKFVAPTWAYKFDNLEEVPFRMKGVQGTNFWWLELGGLEHTIYQADKIHEELVKTSWGVWDYIKNRSNQREQAECWDLEWIGTLPGKRESRRYVGDHMMTQHDIESRGEFKDTVAYGGWAMDDHHPAGLLYPGLPTIFHKAPSPYGIPYRSLYSKNVTNLMFAGRNISATHVALSSTRVMGTCSVMGQAVGTAAAFACQKQVSPRSIGECYMVELQQRLMADDCFLPGFSHRMDVLGQSASCVEQSTLNNGHFRTIGENTNLYEGEFGEPIVFTWKKPTQVEGLRIVFDSHLNHSKRMPCSYPQNDLCRVPKSIIRSFRVEHLNKQNTWQAIYREDENYQRLLSIPLHTQTRSIRLIPEQAWGAKVAKLFACEPESEFRMNRAQIEAGITWSELQAKVHPEDLVEPDSGLESNEKEFHTHSA